MTEHDSFTCPFCGYQTETDDVYGCPNCLGEGLDEEDQAESMARGEV